MSHLKSGTCPKCHSTDVYTTRGLPKRGERTTLAVSSWKFFFLDTYLCLGCGHFEEYVAEKELKDQKVLEKVRETWRRVG